MSCVAWPNQTPIVLAVGERQVSSRWAAAGKQEQVAASSSMEQQAAGKQQVSSRWAATGKQQQAAASSRQAAGKQQASSRQAAGKQQASSNQRLPPWKNDQIYF